MVIQNACPRFSWVTLLVSVIALLACLSGAFSVLIESEPKVYLFVLTYFLYANSYPLGPKTLSRERPGAVCAGGH